MKTVILLSWLYIIVFSTILPAQNDTNSRFFQGERKKMRDIFTETINLNLANKYTELLSFLTEQKLLDKVNPGWIRGTSLPNQQALTLMKGGWTVKRLKEIQQYGIDVYQESFDYQTPFIKKTILLTPLLAEVRVIKTTHRDTSNGDFFATSTVFKVIHLYKGDITDFIIVLRQNHSPDASGYSPGKFFERGRHYIIALSHDMYKKSVEQARLYKKRYILLPANYYVHFNNFSLCTKDKSQYPLWEKTPDDEFLTWIDYTPEQATQVQIEEIQTLSKIINKVFQKTQ
jgi:hypothetical protein